MLAEDYKEEAEIRKGDRKAFWEELSFVIKFAGGIFLAGFVLGALLF
ncbi:MAG: hypothetical protein ACFCUR_20885 [Rhodomicrobiaceae bacterium]